MQRVLTCSFRVQNQIKFKFFKHEPDGITEANHPCQLLDKAAKLLKYVDARSSGFHRVQTWGHGCRAYKFYKHYETLGKFNTPYTVCVPMLSVRQNTRKKLFNICPIDTGLVTLLLPYFGRSRPRCYLEWWNHFRGVFRYPPSVSVLPSGTVEFKNAFGGKYEYPGVNFSGIYKFY